MSASLLGPRVPSPFVQDLLIAFLKRRKALKYKMGVFEVSIGCGENDGRGRIEAESQFLQVEARTRGGPSTEFALKIWENGEMWLGISRPGPRRRGGWALNETFHGSAEKLDGQKLVELYEESLLGLRRYQNGEQLRQRILSVWKGHLG